MGMGGSYLGLRCVCGDGWVILGIEVCVGGGWVGHTGN